MFESKINFDFKLTQQIINKISYIDSFKGKWDLIENEKNLYLKELKQIATIESIGSSTRIEGATLTNEEIKELLKNIKINKIETRDEQEVIGYYDTLNIIFDNFQNIDISTNYIKQLHGILLKLSSKDQRHKGQYKILSNKVVANYPNNIQKVIFNTTEPHLVEKEITELINWTNKALKKNEIHKLIIIALFIYEFLSIHPFQDGNGRLSRILTTFLLLKYNYNFIKYISFEHIIEQRKKEYYQSLMECQKNRYKKTEKIDKWLLFFLESLELLIQKLEIKYNEFSKKGGYLNERQKILFEFIKNNQPLKKNDIIQNFQNISENTIKKDIIYLINEKFIKTVGKGKGTIYIT
jgi:Fic family protein